MILRAPLRFALPGLLALLAGLPAGSAAPGFDPARVRSRSCKAPGWVCGFQPSTADDLAAVPVANSLLEAPAHPGGRSRLPARVDLGAQMPPVGDQGPRASGVAWALAYGLMSHGRASRDSDPNPISNAGSIVQAPGRGNASRKPCVAEAPDADQLYSPAHLYNALNMGKDAGIDLLRAGRYLVRQGAVDCSAVPYDPDTFEIAPAVGAPESSTNARFRARGLRRLAPSNLAEIQARLARGQAVAIGLSIYEDFYELGRGVYEAPPADLRARSFRGGHAVVLVGYDHNKKSAGGDAGAFRFLNSFSRDWGDQGYGWISYRAFHKLVREAVILDFADSDSLEFASGATVAPGAPAEVEATRGHFVDRIVVQYSASPGAVAYEISRAWPRALGGKNADRDADPFETIGYSRTPVFVDRTVQPEVAFRYRVRAIGVAGVSSRSVAIAEGFATKTGAKNKLPLRAVGLRALARVADIAADQAHVQLAWNPAMGARAYRVMRFEADRNRWRVLSRSQTQTEYLDRRPQRGVWNVYRVQALNDAGSAPWSESARVLIGGAGMAPGMVTRTRASRGSYGGRVDVVWDAVPGADRYRVYRFAGQAPGASDGRWEGPFEASGPAYVDMLQNEAENNGAYIAYRVAAGNAFGFSSPGPAAFGFANPAGDANDENAEVPPPLAPPPEARLESTAGGVVQIAWSPVVGAVEYYVLRKRVGETDFGFVGNVAAPGAGDGAPVFREEFPGEAGDLFLYTVRAKPAGAKLETGDSNIVVAFQNPVPSETRKRFFWPADGGAGNQASSDFTGVWTAMDWDGESGPRRIEMRIVQNGPRFEGEYRIGNNPARTFQGEYTYGSQVLETRGFRMELLRPALAAGGSQALAAESIVRIDTRDLSPYDVELAFERAVR